jgi:hypothetical protein
MKERIFFDDEFERQLKEKSDQFKMYPSDKVWNEVYSSLHTRRRRFVVGMTLLIGGILFLAGTQLIFPTKISNLKTGAAKVNNPAKPAVAAGLHNFTSDNFSPAPPDNSEDNHGPDGKDMVSPFILPSIISTNRQNVSDALTVVQAEKSQTGAHIKPVQAAEMSQSIKTTAPIVEADINDLNENSLLAQTGPVIKPSSTDMAIEKSVSQPAHVHNDRFSWEIYIAPTLNKHYLSGINYATAAPSIQNAPIMVVNIANVNGFVDNTPVMGYALGGNILYRISKNISLKAGLEFSFNRYYIKAYNSNQPQSSATLNSYLGYIADSLVNSNSGYSLNKNSQHIQNRYYELSMPVGLEMKVAGSGRVQLHMGVNIQPSYLLNTDAYVLTDDYNNYTKDPQAFRRWNLNAGAEAFISYSVGKIRWELGPQVRYQIFSTYKNSYPLNENMLNYGIRVGISKTIW